VQVIGATVVARRGSVITVEKVASATLDAGQHFSVGYRLYRIESIITQSGGSARFRFWPPAREGIIAGAELDFDQPAVKVRLVDDNAMDHALDLGRTSSPSLRCLEDPN
jgi:hypothetical protein